MRLVDLVDVSVVILVAVLAYAGSRRSIALSTYDIIVGGLSVVIATLEYHLVGAAFASWYEISKTSANAFGFLAIIVAVELLRHQFGALFRDIRLHAFHNPGLNELVEALAGSLVAVIRATYVIAYLLAAVSTLPATASWQGVVVGAPIPRLIQVGWTDYLPSVVQSLVGGVTARSIGGEPLPIVPGSPGHLDPIAQSQIVDMTNLARRQAGLAPLVVDPGLTSAADEHTTDMARLALLLHDSPTTGSVNDRLLAAGVGFHLSAENVAFALTLESAFSGLMASPDHRQNILSPDFRRIGVSASQTDPSGILITQDFAD